MKKVLVASLVWFAVACGGSKDSSRMPGMNPEPLQGCETVVTEAAIELLNRNQSDFQIRAAGMNAHCQAEQNINGNVTRVDVTGYTAIRIIPGQKFLSVEPIQGGKFTVTLIEQQITRDDARTILKAMGVAYDDASIPYEVGINEGPSYIRFGKGAIFYVSRQDRREVDKKILSSFILSAEREEMSLLATQIASFQNSGVPMELLYGPNGGSFGRQLVEPEGTPIRWSQLSATEVLVSLVREGGGQGNPTKLLQAIDLSLGWNPVYSSLNNQLPELFRYAESEWVKPSIADNTVSRLLTTLRYLLKVNPAHARKPVMDTYDRIGGFFQTQALALRAAVDYLSGQSWSRDQFELLADASTQLARGFSGNSWMIAESLARANQFERTAVLFAARAGGELQKRGLLRSGDPAHAGESINEKVRTGLTPSNLDFYLEIFDSFVRDLRADTRSAEQACDGWILSGKLTPANVSVYRGLLLWLKSEAYLNFSDSAEVVGSLIRIRSLDSALVLVFQQSYDWLKGTVYLGRSEALEKAGKYVGTAGFDSATLARIKSYFSWLTGTIYLGKTDALARVEAGVLNGAVSDPDLQNIRSLTEWFINTIYLGKTDALSRSESLVIQRRLSPAQTQILKDMATWMIGTLFLGKTEAADRAERYVTGPRPLDVGSAAQLRDLTQWFTGTIYLGRTEALSRAEGLVLTSGLTPAQTDLMKTATEWLKSSVYLGRNEAADKAESYVTRGRMSAATYSLLRQEFDYQTNHGKGRQEALRIAESKVLGL